MHLACGVYTLCNLPPLTGAGPVSCFLPTDRVEVMGGHFHGYVHSRRLSLLGDSHFPAGLEEASCHVVNCL